MDSLSGHFLIASPSILDPNFRRTVVFVTAHTEEGAVGVILNRRSEATVGEAVPQLAPVIDADDQVYVGGPVNPEGVAVLAEFDDPGDAGVVVMDDVGFVALDEALEGDTPELQRAIDSRKRCPNIPLPTTHSRMSRSSGGVHFSAVKSPKTDLVPVCK